GTGLLRLALPRLGPLLLALLAGVVFLLVLLLGVVGLLLLLLLVALLLVVGLLVVAVHGGTAAARAAAAPPGLAGPPLALRRGRALLRLLEHRDVEAPRGVARRHRPHVEPESLGAAVRRRAEEEVLAVLAERGRVGRAHARRHRVRLARLDLVQVDAVVLGVA